MEQYPRTALEFERQFASEAACWDYLSQLRWPDGFRCPRCGGAEAWNTGRGLYHCRGCNLQTSITAGTIFHGTRKPLRVWFEAMWYVTNQKHGVSAKGLARVLGVDRYMTVWTWLHKLRVAMVRPGRDRLSGTVEVDETYIGGPRLGKRGRGAEGKCLVLVAVEDKGKGLGRIRLRQIADASANSLTPAVTDAIEPGSVIRTDDWKGYNRLPSQGYSRQIARKTADVGENLLPLANRVISLLKRWLGDTHQGAVRPSHLDYYLDEFTFRFNRRTSASRGKLFYRLLQQAAAVGSVSDQRVLASRAPDSQPQHMGGT